jgi:glycosyltransferase involved in cell wall biosynthesis
MREFVSFIVIAHQNSVTLSECLRSAEAQALQGDELILVLNNPDPQTKYEATKNQNWHIIFESSQGPQFARNSGAQYASKSILCFLDADVSLPKNWRSQMVSNFSNPWIAIGQSKIRIINTKSFLSLIKRYQLLKFNSRFYFQNGAIQKGLYMSLDTAAMMVRREWFLRVGGFDKDLSRMEDADFSTRVMYYGGDAFFEDRVCAYEITDPTEHLISFLNKYFKSIRITPLLYQKHLIKMVLPFSNGIAVSNFKKITFFATICDIAFSLVELFGLALSPFEINLLPRNYIEYKGNPKKMAINNRPYPNERSIWVGGNQRFYDLRKNIFSKQQ